MTSQTSKPRRQASSQDFRPRRSLGQHFLKDRTYLENMVQAAEIRTGERVLEIGPGTGVLTKALVDSGAQVTAVELDARLADHLSAKYSGKQNVTIVKGDILELEPSSLMEAGVADSEPYGLPSGYKVVANLPYYITSAILRHILEANTPPTLATVMVQREVADRICAEPNSMSLLAVSVQYYARPQFMSIVPAAAFYPQPKVDSAILRLDVYKQPPIEDVRTDRYFSVVRAGFSQRRKQVANSLSAALGLPKQQVRDALTGAGIDSRRRAETFTLQEWRTVCIALGRD